MTRVSQQKDKIHLKNRIASPSKTVLYILAFIIPLLLVLISFARSNFAPFGDKDVITASGDNNYYVYYYELYDHVHSPDLFTKTEENNISSLFASESISGNSYITDLAYHISDPTNYIILLFLQTTSQHRKIPMFCKQKQKKNMSCELMEKQNLPAHDFPNLLMEEFLF